MLAIIVPLWNPLPMTAPAPATRRAVRHRPSAVAAAPGILGGALRRLGGAADRDRPRLADPVLRPGLGRHPAGRARTCRSRVRSAPRSSPASTSRPTS